MRKSVLKPMFMVSIVVLTLFSLHNFPEVTSASFTYSTNRGCGPSAIFTEADTITYTIKAKHNADKVELWLKNPDLPSYTLRQTWTAVTNGQTLTRIAAAGTPGKRYSYIRVYQGASTYDVMCEFYVYPKIKYTFTTNKGCGGTFNVGEQVTYTIQATHNANKVEQWLKSPATGNVWTIRETWTNVVAGNTITRIAALNEAGTRESYIKVYFYEASYNVTCNYNVGGAPTTAPPSGGTLTIVSNVGGYTIYLNGAYKGTDNGDGIAIIPLNPGNYNIVLQLIGCSPASGSATVTSGTNTTVNLPMTCAMPPPTFPPTVPPTYPPTAPPTYPPTLPPTYPPTLPPTFPPTLPPTAPPNSPPSADAGGNKIVVEGDVVTFDGTASEDPEGNELTYIWDFGDGTTGSGPRPIHKYQKAGQYAISLTVSDGQRKDTSYTTVIVNEKPGFSLGGNMLIYVGLGFVALLLLILIIVMMVRK